MALTIGGLNKAILNRIRGNETLTGEQATAQTSLVALIPTWRLGNLRADGALPSGNIYEDAGVDAQPRTVDSGLYHWSIRRFEIWNNTTDESVLTGASEHLMRLFDLRKGATMLDIPGDGKLFDMALFVGMQGPFFDDQINAWYGTMAFSFLEARP